MFFGGVVDKVKLDGNEIPSAQLDGDEEMK